MSVQPLPQGKQTQQELSGAQLLLNRVSQQFQTSRMVTNVPPNVTPSMKDQRKQIESVVNNYQRTTNMMSGDFEHQDPNSPEKQYATSRMSRAISDSSSSDSNSSRIDRPGKRKEEYEETEDGRSSRRKSVELATQNMTKKQQIKIFVISYFTNIFSLMGLSYSFVTASFYDKDDDTDKNFNNKTVTLPEIQVVLLVTGMMYIILGSFLEYIRHIEIRIIIPIISLFGILKIIVGIYDIFVDLDLEEMVIGTVQLVHFIVLLRLAISTIFITGLAKWFSRSYLHLVIGAWFTNEFVAFEMYRWLQNYKNIMIAVSGGLLLVSCYFIYYNYRLDPIDADLIINEQAINLTSQYTDTFRTQVQLEDFIQEMKNTKQTFQEKLTGAQTASNKSLEKQKLAMTLNDQQEKVLRRWKTPSLLQTLRINGVLPMIVSTTCLFFRYRILNKLVVIISKQVVRREGIIGCFLLASETIQFFFGYLILMKLKGRRYLLQGLLILIALLLEITQIIIYSFSEKVDFESLSTYYITILQGIVIYTLYYMMCICGPVDMAKVELLKSNIKITGMLYGVFSGFQCVFQALFLDELIEKFLNKNFFDLKVNFYVITVVNVACTLVALWAISAFIKEEVKELRNFGLTNFNTKSVGKQNPNSNKMNENDGSKLAVHNTFMSGSNQLMGEQSIKSILRPLHGDPRHFTEDESGESSDDSIIIPDYTVKSADKNLKKHSKNSTSLNAKKKKDKDKSRIKLR